MLRAAVLALITLGLLAGLAFAWARISADRAKKIWLLAFVLVVDGGMTTMTAHSFLARWGFRGDDARCGLEGLIDGTAARPFVYRRLAPELIGAATNVVVSHVSPAKLEAFAEASPLKRYRVDQGPPRGLESWTPRKAVAFQLAYVLVWFSLFGTTLAAAALIQTVRRCSWFEALATATLATALVPLMFVGGGYVYDAPELLIWTALLTVVLRGWTWASVPLFALMLFNKESALIGLPALAVIFWQQRGLVWAAAWSGGLGLLGVAWFFYVRHLFVALPGQPMESWLSLNLHFWTDPRSYFKVGQFFAPGLPSPRGANLLVLVLVFLPFKWGWRDTPRTVRAATLATACVLVPLFIKSCYMDEIRNLSLLFPLFYVITVYGVHTLLQRPDESATAHS